MKNIAKALLVGTILFVGLGIGTIVLYANNAGFKSFLDAHVASLPEKSKKTTTVASVPVDIYGAETEYGESEIIDKKNNANTVIPDNMQVNEEVVEKEDDSSNGMTGDHAKKENSQDMSNEEINIDPKEKYDPIFYEYYYGEKPKKQTWPSESPQQTTVADNSQNLSPQEKYDPAFYEYYYGDNSASNSDQETVSQYPVEAYASQEQESVSQPSATSEQPQTTSLAELYEQALANSPGNNSGFPSDIWQSTIDKYGADHSEEYLRYRQRMDFNREHMDVERAWCREWVLSLTQGGQ